MPIQRRLRQRFWPFTIKAYALGFIILISLVFGVLGWALQAKLDAIRSESQKHDVSAARAELARVTARIIDEVKQRTKNLAGQDETRQQLADPAYYGYWRDNRALRGGVLPDYTEAVEIYTRQGTALAKHPINNMPQTITKRDLTSFLVDESGRVYLYVFLEERRVG